MARGTFIPWLRACCLCAGTGITLSLSPAATAQTSVLDAAVDLNGDGVIAFRGIADGSVTADSTSRDRPFWFWLNDDQDDLELYESWPRDRPDLADDRPGSLRDLEDLTRLHIFHPQWRQARDSGAVLRLRWSDPATAPVIRLWRVAGNDCSRAYLEETAAGQRQLQLPTATALGVVSDAPLTMPLSGWRHGELEQDRLCFLFEGVSSGQGTLRVELEAGGRLRTAQPLHIGIRPVKTFYDRVALDWPHQTEYPWNYYREPPPVDLKARPDPMGFDFQAPWYEDDHVILWVHGWIPHEPEEYARTLVFSFETMWKRFWHQGFRGRMVHFRWPTLKSQQVLGLLRSAYRGYKSAPALLAYIDTLPPDRHVHVTCHSLGGVLLLEALKQGLEVEEAVFQVSAVPSAAFDDNEQLVIPGREEFEAPQDAADMGYRGYLGQTRTRIYNLYNPSDVTWLGWNMAQRSLKPYSGTTRRYYYNTANGEDSVRLRYWWFFSRPVNDPHEAMALAVPARTQALGGEGRVAGVVHKSFDLSAPPYEFGADHVAMWRWNPQKVLPYFNLMLDLFNIPYNSAGRAGSEQ